MNEFFCCKDGTIIAIDDIAAIKTDAYKQGLVFLKSVFQGGNYSRDYTFASFSTHHVLTISKADYKRLKSKLGV